MASFIANLVSKAAGIAGYFSTKFTPSSKTHYALLDDAGRFSGVSQDLPVTLDRTSALPHPAASCRSRDMVNDNQLVEVINTITVATGATATAVVPHSVSPIFHGLAGPASRCADPEIIHCQTTRPIYARYPHSSPIFKLPNEVLTEIFLALQRALLKECYLNWESSLWGNSNSWLAVLGVCRHWKAVACNHQSLWNRLILTPSINPHIFLRRSGARPLIVHFCVDGSPKESLRIVLDNLHRVVHLSVRSPTKIWPIVDNADSTAALEKLYISTSSSEIGDDAVQSKLPTLFRGGKFPKLVVAELLFYEMDWSASILSRSLRHLRITSGWDATTTIEHIVTALEGMPLLEHLSLSDVLPYGTLTANTAQKIATMPQLRYLYLEDTLYGCVTLLNHIHLPIATATLCVDVSCYEADPEAALTAALQKKMLRSSSLQTLALWFIGRSEVPPASSLSYILKLAGWPYDLPCIDDGNSLLHMATLVDPRLSPSLSLTIRTTKTAQVPTILQNCGLETVQKLFLGVRDHAPQERLQILRDHAYGFFPTLEVLQLNDVDTVLEFSRLLSLPINSLGVLPYANLVGVFLEPDLMVWRSEESEEFSKRMCAALRTRQTLRQGKLLLVMDRCGGGLGERQHNDLSDACDEVLCLHCPIRSHTAKYQNYM